MPADKYRLPSIVRLSLLVLVLAVVGVSGGCGDGGRAGHSSGLSEEQRKARIEAARLNDLAEGASTTKPKEDTPKTASPTQTAIAVAARPKPPNDGEIASPAPKALTKPVRPNDVANWKRDDYLSAKRDGDPRLEAAVTRLGERFRGSANAASLLAKLLESATLERVTTSIDDDGGPGPAAPSTKLTQAIIGSLVANGTPDAIHTIEGLLAGTFKTTNPQAASTAVIETLLEHPCRQNEDMLFQFVVSQNSPAAGNRIAVDLERIYRASVARIVSAASDAFRIRLANHMNSPETPQTIYDQLWTYLKEPRAEYLAPQIILYRGGSTDRPAQQLLETQFAAQSSAAMRCLLGIRPPKTRGQKTADPFVITDPCRVIKPLWGPDLTTVVERRLQTLDSLENSASVAILASSLPNDSVRWTLARSLEKHWDEGPRRLEPLGALDGPAVEPGFVALLKTLPRKDAPASTMPPVALDRRVGNSPVASAKREAKQRQDRTAQQWMEFSKNIVMVVCDRLHQAARDESPSSDSGSLDVVQDSFPLKLHPHADVVAVRRLNWPEDIADKLRAGPSLQVGYVRIEQKSQPAKVLAHYRRVLPNRKEHTMPNGLWLDCMTRDREKNTVRSIDVLLTKSKTGTAVRSLPDQEQLLVVEILYVECADMSEIVSASASR
jgi:hypothetical protein